LLSRPPKYQVGGVGVTEITFDNAVEWLLAAPSRGERLSVHFITAHTVVEASRLHSLRDALAAADLVAADGMPLVWMGRLQGRRVSRVCGPDLMPAVIDGGRQGGARHFFYGGAEGVPERLAAALQERFPGVQVVGTRSPAFRPLTPEEEIADLERINAAQPDYVWVGLGSPKQDLWIAKHRPRLNAAALLAVGAAFNIHTGELRRAPRWMQGAGLEWLFRLIVEPRRLWYRYTVVNARFVWLVARQAARALVSRLIAVTGRKP
jgi:N-acetylglucosaminyldiphosphoundecaprenol N-acetyl-beta-D-mannosaminyltransferase